MTWRSTDDIAIIGVGTTEFGAMYRQRGEVRSAFSLAAQAFTAAVRDAGIERDDVDGLFCTRVSYKRMADMLGIRQPRVANSFEASGRMSGVSIQFAAAAIRSGLAHTVACVYGNNGRSAGARYGGEEAADSAAAYDAAYGMTSPGAYVSMMYQRYAADYKVPDAALAPIAINNRRNAMLNDNAVMRDPLTAEEYASARYIAEPLRLYDYCLINDGGVALILTTTERARKLGRPVITLSATSSRGDLTNAYTSRDFFLDSSRQVAADVYNAAGIGRDQVDTLQIYDNFTPTVLFSLEGFGYCEPGTAWDWVRDGRIELGGGGIPINTSGGHTSESYMQGFALHVEAVRQLRGECGDRQVPECEVAQYICVSPIVTSHVFRRIE